VRAHIEVRPSKSLERSAKPARNFFYTASRPWASMPCTATRSCGWVICCGCRGDARRSCQDASGMRLFSCLITPADYYRLISCCADDSAHESSLIPLLRFVGFAAASSPLVRCGWRPWDPPCSRGGKALCVSRYIWGRGTVPSLSASPLLHPISFIQLLSSSARQFHGSRASCTSIVMSSGLLKICLTFESHMVPVQRSTGCCCQAHLLAAPHRCLSTCRRSSQGGICLRKPSCSCQLLHRKQHPLFILPQRGRHSAL
jgi:hypothetical protein